MSRLIGCHLGLFGGVSFRSPTLFTDRFATNRSAKLLVLLALSRSGKMHRSQVASLLWPEDPYDSSRLRLRQEIHRLKQSLGAESELVGSSSTDIWIERAHLSTDLDLLDKATPESDLKAFGALFESEFLPGWFDPWVVAERTSVEPRLVRSLVRMATSLNELTRYDDTLALLAKPIERFPLEEELRMAAIAAHVGLGKMAAALAEHQDFRRRMRDDLGVEVQELSLESLAREQRRDSTPYEIKILDFGASLPPVTEQIFGRESLIESVLKQLQSPHSAAATTLVGPGGIGKTRLALALAHSLNESNEGQVAYASLVDLAQPEDWAKSVVYQLGADVPESTDALAFLASLLSDRRYWLIIDNAESAIDTIRADWPQIARRAPQVRLVATSIQPIGIPGESEIRIGPIDAATSGTELLLSYLTAFRPLKAQDPDALNALRKIAKALDGYPLALRLAGARLKLLNAEELLNQIELSFTGTRLDNLPQRHRSLASAMQSSFDLLDRESQLALERVAAYPAGLGMNLAAIEFGTDQYLEVLESLLDSGLIVLDESALGARVRTLNPVKHFVSEQAQTQDQHTVKSQIVENIFLWLDRLELGPWKPLSMPVLDQIQEEEENLIAAWQSVLSSQESISIQRLEKIARLEAIRGRSMACLAHCQGLANQFESGSAEVQLRFELLKGYLAISSHNTGLAKSFLDQASQLGADSELSLRAKLCLAQAEYAFRKEFDSAEKHALEALALALECGDDYVAARAQMRLGTIAEYRHDIIRAVELLSQAYHKLQELQVCEEIIHVGTYWASLLNITERKDEVQSVLDETQNWLAKSRDPQIHAYRHEAEGRILISQGQYEAAEAKFRNALELWTAIGVPFQIADQNHSLCNAQILQEKWRGAREHAYHAFENWMLDDNLGGMCCTLSLITEILIHDNRRIEATETISFAHALWKEMQLPIIASELERIQMLKEQLGASDLTDLVLDWDSIRTLVNRVR